MTEHLEESRAGMARKFIKFIKGTGRWFRKGGRNIWVPNSKIRKTSGKVANPRVMGDQTALAYVKEKKVNLGRNRRYVKKSYTGAKGASPSIRYTTKKVPESNLMRNQVPDTLSSIKRVVKKGWDSF